MTKIAAVRRRLVGFLNQSIAPRLGFKIVRSWPKQVRYQRTGRSKGADHFRIQMGGRSAEVEVRSGTSDWMTFDQIFVDEDFDLRSLKVHPELKSYYDRLVRSSKTPLIVDLGANTGYSSLYFSMVWPKARIVAVEPDPDNYKLLEKNTRQMDSIVPIRAGISSQEGTLSILDPSADKNAIRTKIAEPNAEGVPAITMQRILSEAGDGAAAFIAKIDIEGAEGELFSANYEWMDEFPMVIIELHDWLYPGEGTSRNFLKAVAGMNRDFIYLDENVFSVRNPIRA